MTPTDGIIFDMDGTIWDNTGLFAISWTNAAKRLGYDMTITSDMLKREFGKKMDVIAENFFPDADPKLRLDTLRWCEKTELDELMNSAMDTTYVGLETSLVRLNEMGIPLYIVSNCQSGYIESYLEKHGHGGFFSGFLCYGDNGCGKAENIKILMQKHGIRHPVYVGDIQGDKDSCDEAGIPFIWAAYGYGKSVDGYVEKIDDIGELPNVVLAVHSPD